MVVRHWVNQFQPELLSLEIFLVGFGVPKQAIKNHITCQHICIIQTYWSFVGFQPTNYSMSQTFNLSILEPYTFVLCITNHQIPTNQIQKLKYCGSKLEANEIENHYRIIINHKIISFICVTHSPCKEISKSKTPLKNGF